MSTPVNELTPFTMPDSGVNLKIRKVSPLLIMELRRQLPEPTPPKQIVTLPSGDTIEEANPSHPDYLAAREAYTIEFEEKLRRLLLKRGVDINLTDEQKAELEQLKAEYLEETGFELRGNPAYQYLSFIAIATDEDMTDLITAITKRSQPSPGGIEAARRSFRGESKS